MQGEGYRQYYITNVYHKMTIISFKLQVLFFIFDNLCYFKGQVCISNELMYNISVMYVTR